MKLNRTNLFILTSSIALLIVLTIQVNWILQAAKMKEEMFNEKVNIILSKTAEALSTDNKIFKNLKIPNDGGEVRKIDSLFNYYMKVYNIHIDYFFEVTPTLTTTQKDLSLTNYVSNDNAGSYSTCIENPSDNNLMELKLIFPKQEQYIKAEMKTPFISSITLILVVLFLSWRTILSLDREKKISENTSDYLNNMTHEFKTPLTNIALAGKMILKSSNIQQEDKVKHYSGIILEENEKLRRQVEQVLSMTALERGEIPLNKTELDFHHVIHDTLNHIGIQIENRDGDVQLSLNAERFIILGDKTHLTNALRNLIDNAIKYSPGKPEIIISTYNVKNKLEINISDKGVGIDKEYQKKVFEKYFRVPTGDVHDVKGFGLGLSYVKRIVELHDGNLALKSKVGDGATFIISFPLSTYNSASGVILESSLTENTFRLS